MKFVDPNKHWYVVRTNIKCERKAAANIRQAGFDVYLPMCRVEKQDRRSKVYVERESPLMLRYLFVGFDPKAKHFGFVRSCEGVERLLEVEGQPISVPGIAVASIQAAEIDMVWDDTRKARIHRKEEAVTKRKTLEMTYSPGKTVFVSDPKHPFVDFTATVEEVTRAGNIKALVNLFGRMVPVEFDAPQLSAA